jgi:hypothetical protein
MGCLNIQLFLLLNPTTMMQMLLVTNFRIVALLLTKRAKAGLSKSEPARFRWNRTYQYLIQYIAEHWGFTAALAQTDREHGRHFRRETHRDNESLRTFTPAKSYSGSK